MRGALVVLPALIVLVALRIVIQPAPLATAAPGIPAIIQRRLAEPPLMALKSYTWGTFGVLGLLPFLTRRNLVHLRTFGLFIALIYAQLLVAINTERLLVLAFPAVILMSCETIRAYAMRDYGRR